MDIQAQQKRIFLSIAKRQQTPENKNIVFVLVFFFFLTLKHTRRAVCFVLYENQSGFLVLYPMSRQSAIKTVSGEAAPRLYFFTISEYNL